VDAEGCLWTGLFGGWAARRYDPSGKMMAEVRFPVANVTKIAFGGSDLTIAYATTARKGLTDRQLVEQPLAGNLFAFDPGVRGQAGHMAAI
jgi:sugar lactone lactonase YvrE